MPSKARYFHHVCCQEKNSSVTDKGIQECLPIASKKFYLEVLLKLFSVYLGSRDASAARGAAPLREALLVVSSR